MHLLPPLNTLRKGIMTVVAISMLTACSQPAQEQVSVIRPVKLFEVIDSQHQSLREFPAIVTASEEASLSFRIPGELIAFPITPATIVKQGQLLAKLDDRDAKNEVIARQADFDLAESDYRRIQSLRDKKMVSQSDFDNANTRLKSTRVALQLAEDHLKDTVLTAPFSGRIAQKLVENYQSVQAREPVLILQDHTTLDVSIQMPESIITKVRRDQVDQTYQPVVTFAGNSGTEYKASYKEHATQVSSGTQSYEVTFSMPVPTSLTVYPGMGATVSIDMAQVTPNDHSESGFVVPLTAVQKDDLSGLDQVWVYQQETGTITARKVVVGRVTQKGITVLSGLNEDDKIATAGLSRLRNDMQVKPLQRERGV